MKQFLFRQFHTLFPQLAAFAVIVFLSTIVAAYSYVQAKQIKIEADLLIAGEVRTNNLCIGGVCKGAWPAELLKTDPAAAATLTSSWVSTNCRVPMSFGGGCVDNTVWFRSHGSFDRTYDPRGITSVTGVEKFFCPKNTCPSFSGVSGILDNYNDALLQCAAGWTGKAFWLENLLSNSLKQACSQGCWSNNAKVIACTLPL